MTNDWEASVRDSEYADAARGIRFYLMSNCEPGPGDLKRWIMDPAKLDELLENTPWVAWMKSPAQRAGVLAALRANTGVRESVGSIHKMIRTQDGTDGAEEYTWPVPKPRRFRWGVIAFWVAFPFLLVALYWFADKLGRIMAGA